MKEHMRQLPPVHELQKDARFSELQKKSGMTAERLTDFIRRELDGLRRELLNGEEVEKTGADGLAGLVFDRAEKRASVWAKDRLARVINGTGTVLHTNLGRSRLSERAVRRMAEAAGSYTNLEYRIAEGERGSRHDIIEELLKEATGAEAAMAVNNNAAAVFLVLSALGRDREVIVSRGELVEIGGSFRVSSIMEESGARLVEVGTTNKTHLGDYRQAIRDETAMLMKVHTSNFKIVGFTESVGTEQLAGLSREHGQLIFYEDLGSGALFDFKKLGIGEEPVVRDVLRAGADLVSFSGDKLLGGPQAGIIAGKKELIGRLKRHQLARVLRLDKMTLAGLEETLKTYIDGGEEVKSLPTVRDITRPVEGIRQQAEEFVRLLAAANPSLTASILETVSQVGGGTMPDVEIPTVATAVSHPGLTAGELAARLRNGTPAIVTRIADGKVIVDFRTIGQQEMDELIHGFSLIG
ncbi:L-seryl-tRNA(Sec) selenium transferase [Indiicoccus explosivorum]|uniref:L-seryl-tRNA(Sec) selenium transferase n=1 Tax=Indiicoccus explosivorum TaxID=1917864 RepID=UPI000B44FFF8|nr:L-seryl-tRNA(Sec) selenium transferase [Indiicoccus explosivorum]